MVGFRICASCGRSSTFVNRHGVAQWFHAQHGQGYECSRCYQKRDYVREYRRPIERQYYWDHRDYILEHRRQYRKNNPERISIGRLKYRKNNVEKLRQWNREYYAKNREKVIAATTRWAQNNKEHRREYMRGYMREYRRAKKERG